MRCVPSTDLRQTLRSRVPKFPVILPRYLAHRGRTSHALGSEGRDLSPPSLVNRSLRNIFFGRVAGLLVRTCVPLPRFRDRILRGCFRALQTRLPSVPCP